MTNSIIDNFPSKLHLEHIRRLTNQVGILQHAKFSLPNYHHGYCLDDNARALQLTILAKSKYKTNEYDDLIDTYLAYIMYVQNTDGSFKNFISFENCFLDEKGSDDSFGRAIMALGIVLQHDDRSYIIRIVNDILDKSYDRLLESDSLRANAYILCGLHAIYNSGRYSKNITSKIAYLVKFIVHEYEQTTYSDWCWFEKKITYDNALIPYALLLSSEIINDNNCNEIAISSTLFLDQLLFKNGHLGLIGNDGWYSNFGLLSNCGQQPLEIPSLILLYKKMEELNPKIKLEGSAQKSYEWFFGNNNIKLSLYDKETKGCADGIEHNSINYNQGAESTMSLWQSYLYINHVI